MTIGWSSTLAPATLSAYAAATAAAAAAVVALLQFFIGMRQSKAALLSARAAVTTAESAGRRRTAEFRQAWIDKVIDTLSEYVAELVHQWDSEDPEHIAAWKKMAALRVKLEILLNPKEAGTIALLKAADAVRDGSCKEDRQEAGSAVIREARDLLKAEWVRIKAELQ